MSWILVGLKLAQVATAAFQMVEKSKTTEKDHGKLDLAKSFAKEMLGGCGDVGALEAQKLMTSNDPDIHEAFEKYAEAYVNLQNIIAKKANQ